MTHSIRIIRIGGLPYDRDQMSGRIPSDRLTVNISRMALGVFDLFPNKKFHRCTERFIAHPANITRLYK